MGVECLQPVRDAHYPAHATLNALLTLPDDVVVGPTEPNLDDVLDAWSRYLGGQERLLLVKSTDRARKLLMAAFGVDDEPVGIPANTRRPLSEAVKRSQGRPLFLELDADLDFDPATPGLDAARLIWAQPVGGMPAPKPLAGKSLFVDYAFTLPAPAIDAVPGLATLWGLHLSSSQREDGALIAINDPDLYERAKALLDPSADLPDLSRALAQCERVGEADGLADRQIAVYEAATEGLELAGALPQAPMQESCALPFGLVIRVPDEADIATFISYVRNENTPLTWLPELQPMFYVTYQVTQDMERTRTTADNLSRWVVSPLGPDFVDDEVTHAVLGPVKAAEYTGVRWYTNPERALWYNDLMLEWYGPTHDAYRCAFEDKLPELAVAGDDD